MKTFRTIFLGVLAIASGIFGLLLNTQWHIDTYNFIFMGVIPFMLVAYLIYELNE